jgi:hypothetical protein
LWIETPTAWELRVAFPKEAIALEDILVADWLQSLGLTSNRVSGLKASQFRIKLEDNYELLISPVDRGAEGYAEWFTWHQPQHSHVEGKTLAQMPEPSMRAYIQLFYADETGRSQLYSFTNHHQNVESLIRTALQNIHQDLGLKLKPIVKSRKGKRRKE